MTQAQDIITLTENGTLCELLAERVKRSHDAVAYRQYEGSADDWVPWTIDAGLMTPTLKLKREKILEAHGADVDRLYAKR